MSDTAPATAPLRLDERIPDEGFASPDDALLVFLEWVAEQGLRPYAHQEEAIMAIFAGEHVVLDAPTGSGKSLVATARIFKTFVDLGHAWYTAPIKALVSEKFFELCRIFGPEHVGMITGDGAINRDAPIVCCTAEILSNLALREGAEAKVDAAIMDEFHYYADRDRGSAWQVPLLNLPRAQFVLMSATLGDTSAIRADLEARTGRAVTEVRGVHRPVPLTYRYSTKPEQEMLLELTRTGRAPVYVVHFAQSDATEKASALMSLDWCTKEEKRAIVDELKGVRFTSTFGPMLRRYLSHGVGLHHAGLLPRYRRVVERLAQKGLLKVICGTDTLGVGINVPIRSVLFTQLCKYDGEKTEILAVREFQQIAGRAGRAGFDTAGDVVVQAPAHVISNLKIDQEPDPKKRKRMQKAQPPERGYKHWDESTFQRLVQSRPEALTSRMSVDHGRLLMLMQHAEQSSGEAMDGYAALQRLIDTSHAPAHEKGALKKRAETLLESLRSAGILGHDGHQLSLDPELQQDFSLHHALSLFLVHALRTLDKESPTYALDVVSWVEAILDDPGVLLRAQEKRDRGRTINELKAAGVPYEERMAAIEDLTWPKPNADAIYEVYNAYRKAHPWVEGSGIRPKGIAREMIENFLGFGDEIKELGLPRAEGVLLRYLSEVYKALLQNVPVEARTPELDEVLATLRATLAVVDTSLLTEWENMVAGRDGVVDTSVEKPLDISEDKRAFGARVRAELHALVRALARGDDEEATACVRQDPEREDAWNAEAFTAALADFRAAHGGVAFDHRARLGTSTQIRQVAAHQWVVRQTLLPVAVEAGPDTWGFEDPDDAGEAVESWVIEGEIDLRANTNPDGPLVSLRRIGA